MKREHALNSKNIGELIFYAPLEYMDLTDHISNSDAVFGVTPNGNVTWDQNIGAYRFYKMGVGQSCYWGNLNLNINFTNNLFNDNICVEFDIYSSVDPSGDSGWYAESNWRRGVVLGAYTETNQNTFFLPVSWTIYQMPLVISNTWQHIVSFCTSSITSTYVDNIQANDITTEKIGCNAGRQNNSYVNTFLSIGKNDKSNRFIDSYIKNIKIWKYI